MSWNSFLAWPNLCETTRDHGRTNVAVLEWSCHLLATLMHSHHRAIKVSSLAACPTVYCIQYKTVVRIHVHVQWMKSYNTKWLCGSPMLRVSVWRTCSAAHKRIFYVMAPNVWNSLVNDIISPLTLFVKPKTHF